MENEILTIQGAADCLQVSSETVHGLLQGGELAGRQIAGEWRTTKRALLSYVDGAPLDGMCCVPEGCCTPATAATGEISAGKCCG